MLGKGDMHSVASLSFSRLSNQEAPTRSASPSLSGSLTPSYNSSPSHLTISESSFFFFSLINTSKALGLRISSNSSRTNILPIGSRSISSSFRSLSQSRSLRSLKAHAHPFAAPRSIFLSMVLVIVSMVM